MGIWGLLVCRSCEGCFDRSAGRASRIAPDDSHLIDATNAYYVLGPRLQGAMGAVLASFSDEQAAQNLVAEKGGRVMRFDQQLLQEAAAAQHGGVGHGAHGDHSGH
ncbi:hypothetical protein HKW98_14195 [Stutzerimonas urumqiensis]